MATTLFDIRITTRQPKRVRKSTLGGIEGLFRQPELSSKKEKLAGSILAQETIPSAPVAEITAADLAVGFGEFVARANTVLDTLKERGAKLTYVFDPNLNLNLSAAVSSIFEGETSRITYEMYQQALILDKDIAQAQGESLYGGPLGRGSSATK